MGELLKFRFQDTEDVADGFNFQIRAAFQLFLA